MNILFGNIFQVNTVNLSCIINIMLHSGRSCNIRNILWDLKDPAAVVHAQLLHGRCDSQADGLVTTIRVCYHQIGSHGIQSPFHALHGGIE